MVKESPVIINGEEVLETELLAALRQLNKKASKGDDRIESKIAVSLIKKETEWFRQLYQRTMDLSYFPAKWKRSRCIAIPKADAAKARVVNIQCVFGKILEILIENRLKQYIPIDLMTNQYAYMKGIGRDHAILELHHQIDKLKKKGNKVAIVGVDVKGAFDSISREWIIEMIKEWNFNQGLKVNS